jgi:hypothetical protein
MKRLQSRNDHSIAESILQEQVDTVQPNCYNSGYNHLQVTATAIVQKQNMVNESLYLCFNMRLFGRLCLATTMMSLVMISHSNIFLFLTVISVS